MFVQPSDDTNTVVLIVEDEIIVRISSADILQDAGYHVVEARDGVEALAIFEMRDDVAAMLTDVTMPNMDGISLAKIVCKRWSNVGIVVTSKPYKPDTLLREIAAVIPTQGTTPVALRSIPTLQPGKMHGSGGIAQPLAEPEK
jgi:CheY-like chemotaxis protein